MLCSVSQCASYPFQYATQQIPENSDDIQTKGQIPWLTDWFNKKTAQGISGYDPQEKATSPW
jgi:hypothetical protein